MTPGLAVSGQRDERESLYLKVAVVNLDATILDSNDLSTIRGSSLIALRLPLGVISMLAHELDGSAMLDVVYEGASEVLARLTPPPEERGVTAWPEGLPRKKPKGMGKQQWRKLLAGHGLDEREGAAPRDLSSLAAQVEERLAAICARPEIGGLPSRRFTLAFATHQPGAGRTRPGLEDTVAVLDTRIRVRQLTRPSVPWPDPGPVEPLPVAKALCAVTGILAADPKARAPKIISSSVSERRRTGRAQKQAFYRDEFARTIRRTEDLLASLRDLADGDPAGFAPQVAAALGMAADRLRGVSERLADERLGFAKDFQDIVAVPEASAEAARLRRLPPGVRSKLAVIAIDGNKFGRRFFARSGDPGRLARFSSYVRVQSGLLLADLLDWMIDRSTMRVAAAADAEEAPERLRFETLLWGGDEMQFVLPAWEGWAFMQQLQNLLGAWSEPELDASGQLTFGAGIAFGQVKTPIRDLKDVAGGELLTAAKSKPEANQVQVLSLEGIDRVSFSLQDLRAGWFGGAAGGGPPQEAFSMDGARLGAIADRVGSLKRRLGQTQLQRWYQAAVHHQLLRRGPSDDEVRYFRDAMVDRLGTLGASADELELLTGDLLAGDPDRYPLLPLHQLLDLWDYIDPFAPGSPS